MKEKEEEERELTVDEIFNQVLELDKEDVEALQDKGFDIHRVLDKRSSEQREEKVRYYVEDFEGDLLELEEFIALLEERKGQDIAVMDLSGKCRFANYMIFCTGQNSRHMRVLAMSIVKELRKRDIPGLNPEVEGLECDDWMLVDGGNVIVHVFSPEARAVYDLERKWAFQKVEQFELTNFDNVPMSMTRPKRKKKQRFEKKFGKNTDQ